MIDGTASSRQQATQLVSSTLLASCDVIIPTYNEERCIADVVKRVPKAIRRIVIVDGTSDDLTIEKARAADPRVDIVLRDRRGKGSAIRCGLKASTAEYAVILDGDGSIDSNDLMTHLAPLAEGYAFVKGYRVSGDGSLVRRLGQSAITSLVNWKLGSDFNDVCCGLFALRRNHQDVLGLSFDAYSSDMTRMAMGDGFEIDALLAIRAFQARLPIAQCPVESHSRSAGVSKLHPLRDGLRITHAIFKYA